MWGMPEQRFKFTVQFYDKNTRKKREGERNKERKKEK